MVEALLGIATCCLLFLFAMIGHGAHEQAAKTDCDLRGSMVLQGVVYECKLKETR